MHFLWKLGVSTAVTGAGTALLRKIVEKDPGDLDLELGRWLDTVVEVGVRAAERATEAGSALWSRGQELVEAVVAELNAAREQADVKSSTHIFNYLERRIPALSRDVSEKERKRKSLQGLLTTAKKRKDDTDELSSKLRTAQHELADAKFKLEKAQNLHRRMEALTEAQT